MSTRGRPIVVSLELRQPANPADGEALTRALIEWLIRPLAPAPESRPAEGEPESPAACF